MKNLDYKLRKRFEKREYEGDRYGETRVDRIINKKLCKEQERAKAKFEEFNEKLVAVAQELQQKQVNYDELTEKEKETIESFERFA